MQENPQVSTTPPLSGADAVDQINKALQTIATNFSGDVDPAALAWPYSLWADTANGRIKRRNGAGTAWIDAGPLFPDGAGMLKDVRVFDSPGIQEYTRPSWLRFVVVEVQAGGGGGGRAQSGSGSAEGGGGGGGGYARKLILGADISASESVTVGGGGAGGTAGTSAPDGQPGGASSFGSHLSANPGLGGGQGTNSTGNQNATRGLGGAGVGGDINIRGGDGGVGRVIGGIAVLGNRGGSSHLGGSSMSRAGAAYGGGGSGVSIAPTGSNTAGFDGAPGIVVIWEYA